VKTVIELENISKVFGNLTALGNINLNIQEGEVFSLLGPNGSGKTTLLRIMAGLEKPTSGEIRFKGMKVNQGNTNETRLKITMAFQKTTLFNTSVHKNITYGLRLRGHSKRETDEKVIEVLRIVQLEGYEKRPAKKLSGGEQQRVALARALVLDTEVLLLDEPTANIDPKNIAIIEETLSWLNKEKRTTIVIATHNMFQAETLASRAALLLEGRIEKIGTIQDIFTLPSKTLTKFARLENVFTGVSEISKEGTSIIDVGGGVQIETALRKPGNVSVYVRPEDIIISVQPIVSSARNTFEGRLTGISDLGSIVKLRVKAGKDFTVQITKRSFNEMQLNLDSKVFLAFKASAVQMV
jgi:tungstate transport system ATP-binding protein